MRGEIREDSDDTMELSVEAPMRGEFREGEWLSIDASSARLFRLGEYVRAGQHLGWECGGDEPIRASIDGRIVGIQYDIWRDTVILMVTPEEQVGALCSINRGGAVSSLGGNGNEEKEGKHVARAVRVRS